MKALWEAVRLVTVQAYYELRPPKSWVDGMGGIHPASPRVRAHMLAWTRARHDNPWVGHFRKWIDAAVSTAVLVTLPLWLLPFIGLVAVMHWSEQRAHQHHAIPDRDCFWCQTRPKLGEQKEIA